MAYLDNATCPHCRQDVLAYAAGLARWIGGSIRWFAVLVIALGLLEVVVAALRFHAGSAGGANAKDAWRPFAAVVCTSEASGPWTLRASGTLIRTKSESGLAYKFRGGEHALDWSFTTTREGHTTARGPGFLMERFLPKQTASEPGARRQSLDATGEIREYAAAHALVLRIGSQCPRGHG